jgi:hypothetical protein
MARTHVVRPDPGDEKSGRFTWPRVNWHTGLEKIGVSLSFMHGWLNTCGQLPILGMPRSVPPHLSPLESALREVVVLIDRWPPIRPTLTEDRTWDTLRHYDHLYQVVRYFQPINPTARPVQVTFVDVVQDPKFNLNERARVVRKWFTALTKKDNTMAESMVVERENAAVILPIRFNNPNPFLHFMTRAEYQQSVGEDVFAIETSRWMDQAMSISFHDAA